LHRRLQNSILVKICNTGAVERSETISGSQGLSYTAFRPTSTAGYLSWRFAWN